MRNFPNRYNASNEAAVIQKNCNGKLKFSPSFIFLFFFLDQFSLLKCELESIRGLTRLINNSRILQITTIVQINVEAD